MHIVCYGLWTGALRMWRLICAYRGVTYYRGVYNDECLMVWDCLVVHDGDDDRYVVGSRLGSSSSLRWRRQGDMRSC